MLNTGDGGGPWQLSPKAARLHRCLFDSLNARDRANFGQILGHYQQSKNIQRFVESLSEICRTPQQREEIFPLLRAFIPRKHRDRFDYELTRPRSAYGRHYNTYSARRQQANFYQTTRSLPEGYQWSGSLHSDRETMVKSLDQKESEAKSKRKSGRKISTTKVVQLERDHDTGSFGFSIRGGAEYNVGLFISSIDEGSQAETAGLSLGDQIVEANNTDFGNLSHQDAVAVIQQSASLHLLVKSVGKIPGTFKSSSSYRWIDPRGNEVSPPPEYSKDSRAMDALNKSEMRLLGGDDERKVNLFVADGAELGLKIRGGSEHGLGIFIASVDPNSGAERAGFQVGDQILDVNGKSFLDISHKEAVQVLKSAPHMVIRLKDVGVLPHGKKIHDETRWIKEPQSKDSSRPGSANSSKRSTGVKKTPSFYEPMGNSQLTHHSVVDHSEDMLEIKSRQVLPSNEVQAFVFYLKEYRITHISLATFLSVLSDLLKTPEKEFLFGEIRSAILPRDLPKFDEWMEKRESHAAEVHSSDQVQVKYDRQSLNSYRSSDSSTNSWLGLFETGKTKDLQKRKYLNPLPDPPKDFLDNSLDTCRTSSYPGKTQRVMTFEDFPPPPVFVSDGESTRETRRVDDALPEPPSGNQGRKDESEPNEKSAPRRFEGTSELRSKTRAGFGLPILNNQKSSEDAKGSLPPRTNKRTEIGTSRDGDIKDGLYTTMDHWKTDVLSRKGIFNSKIKLHDRETGVIDYGDTEDGNYAAMNHRDDGGLSHAVNQRGTVRTGVCADMDSDDERYASVDRKNISGLLTKTFLPDDHLGKTGMTKQMKHGEKESKMNGGGVDIHIPIYASVDKSTKRETDGKATSLEGIDNEIPPSVPQRLYTESDITALRGMNPNTSQNGASDMNKNFEFSSSRTSSEVQKSLPPTEFPELLIPNGIASKDHDGRCVETDIERVPETLQEFGERSNREKTRKADSAKRSKKERRSRSNMPQLQTPQQDDTWQVGEKFVVELTKHSSNLGLSIAGGTDTENKEIRIKSVKSGDTVAGSCPLLKPGQIILGVDERSLQNVTSGIAAMAIRQAFQSDKNVLKLILENDS